MVLSMLQQTRYLYEFDLYLGKKEKTELGLEETVVLDLFKKSETTNCILYFDNFLLILKHWLRTFSIGEYIVLVRFELTGKTWLL